jgi:hypothetical protein
LAWGLGGGNTKEVVSASAGLQTGLATILPCRAMDWPVAGLMMAVRGIVFIVLGVLSAL